jgi:ABC-2 type transport system permease protein
MGPASAVARRTFAGGRVQTISFALLFALVALVNVVGYRHSYPTRAARIGFVRSFGDNSAARLFYGVPHDLLSVGGYAAWRVSGVLSIFAGMWGLLAAVRSLRGEEDAGRQELLLAGVVGRRGAYLAAVGATGLGLVMIWAATCLGLVAAGLPVGGSAFLALATVSAGSVLIGVGAVASQLAPTRRVALELSSAVLVVALLLRVVADTSASLAWLRWLTPLGWAEELRPFAGPRPAVLALPALTSAALVLAAGLIAVRRDVGRGLLQVSDSTPPRLALLGSAAAETLRAERASMLGWLGGVGFFAFIVGSLATTVSSSNIPAGLRRQLAKVGGASLTTPAGALGLYFLFFVLAIALFGCSQIAAARREESDGELEMLLALPMSRVEWFGGRLLIAAAGMTGLGLAAGVLAWAGASAGGADLSLPKMLEAGANCLPASLLLLAAGALAFGVRPRASSGIAYGLVAAAFVWDLFGALLGAPGWTLALSPFHQVGLVSPAVPRRGRRGHARDRRRRGLRRPVGVPAPRSGRRVRLLCCRGGPSSALSARRRSSSPS